MLASIRSPANAIDSVTDSERWPSTIRAASRHNRARSMSGICSGTALTLPRPTHGHTVDRCDLDEGDDLWLQSLTRLSPCAFKVGLTDVLMREIPVFNRLLRNSAVAGLVCL